MQDGVPILADATREANQHGRAEGYPRSNLTTANDLANSVDQSRIVQASDSSLCLWRPRNSLEHTSATRLREVVLPFKLASRPRSSAPILEVGISFEFVGAFGLLGADFLGGGGGFFEEVGAQQF